MLDAHKQTHTHAYIQEGGPGRRMETYRPSLCLLTWSVSCVIFVMFVFVGAHVCLCGCVCVSSNPAHPEQDVHALFWTSMLVVFIGGVILRRRLGVRELVGAAFLMVCFNITRTLPPRPVLHGPKTNVPLLGANVTNTTNTTSQLSHRYTDDIGILPTLSLSLSLSHSFSCVSPSLPPSVCFPLNKISAPAAASRAPSLSPSLSLSRSRSRSGSGSDGSVFHLHTPPATSSKKQQYLSTVVRAAQLAEAQAVFHSKTLGVELESEEFAQAGEVAQAESEVQQPAQAESGEDDAFIDNCVEEGDVPSSVLEAEAQETEGADVSAVLSELARIRALASARVRETVGVRHPRFFRQSNTPPTNTFALASRAAIRATGEQSLAFNGQMRALYWANPRTSAAQYQRAVLRYNEIVSSSYERGWDHHGRQPGVLREFTPIEQRHFDELLALDTLLAIRFAQTVRYVSRY